MLVVGDREAAEGKVAVRTRKGGDQGAKPVDEVVEMIAGLARSRSAED
jgi:threonyl-tRNA synthetase